MFEGLSVAMVTPMRGGGIDWEAVDRLVDHLLEGGVDGIIPGGTTGEGPTLTMDERRELFRRVRAQCGSRAFVLAGTGTNSFDSTLAQTRMAREEGADGALVVTPYYNKPTQAGLIAHYTRLAKECDLPICLYNVPGRTGVSIAPATVRRLAELPQVVAIKEASGSLEAASEICRDTRLAVLSGEDSLTLPLLSVGAVGVVSVVGNVVPRPLAAMLRAHAAGNVAEARDLHLRLLDLSRVLFIESNPGPVKHALAHLGWIHNELRLPLVPVQEEAARKVEAVLAGLPPEWLPESRRGA